MATQHSPRSGDEDLAVLDAVQERAFLDRYALKGSDKLPLGRTPDALGRRVAQAIAAVEPTPALERARAERFAAAVRGSGSTWAHPLGRRSGHSATLFGCFVAPSLKDSRAGIVDHLELRVEIMARGGGVGMNLSSLRPHGSSSYPVNGTRSDPCAGAERYAVATGDVVQQESNRRGALSLMRDDWHPDSAERITTTSDLR